MTVPLQTVQFSWWRDTSHLQAFPLLSYAVLHWPEHARYSDSLAEDIFDLSIPFYTRMTAIMALMEDENGHVIMLQLYQQEDEDTGASIPYG